MEGWRHQVHSLVEVPVVLTLVALRRWQSNCFHVLTSGIMGPENWLGNTCRPRSMANRC